MESCRLMCRPNRLQLFHVFDGPDRQVRPFRRTLQDQSVASRSTHGGRQKLQTFGVELKKVIWVRSAWQSRVLPGKVQASRNGVAIGDDQFLVRHQGSDLFDPLGFGDLPDRVPLAHLVYHRGGRFSRAASSRRHRSRLAVRIQHEQLLHLGPSVA